MVKTVSSLLLAFLIGALCRVFEVPVPAPPALLGAALVTSMTVGYLLAGRLIDRRAAAARLSGGPTGAPPENGA